MIIALCPFYRGALYRAVIDLPRRAISRFRAAAADTRAHARKMHGARARARDMDTR